MDKADVGAIGEHLVRVELLRRGVNVAVPVVSVAQNAPPFGE